MAQWGKTKGKEENANALPPPLREIPGKNRALVSRFDAKDARSAASAWHGNLRLLLVLSRRCLFTSQSKVAESACVREKRFTRKALLGKKEPEPKS